MFKKLFLTLLIVTGITRAAEPPPGFPNQFWSLGAGLVFTEVPISKSEFKVLMADVYYQSIFYESSPKLRMAGSIGLYGFGLILPVPKAGFQMYFGERTNNIQIKIGANAFYDISVGGHGGMALELGTAIKDRFEITFMTVPAGTDSERDYLEFVGVRDEPGDEPYVVLPYFGLFVSMRY